jgi:hypothetical protein
MSTSKCTTRGSGSCSDTTAPSTANGRQPPMLPHDLNPSATNVEHDRVVSPISLRTRVGASPIALRGRALTCRASRLLSDWYGAVMRTLAKVALLSASALLLAGCAVTTIPEFEAEQTDRDVLAAASSEPDIDASTTRFVGEVEGIELYIARGKNDVLCVIQVRGQEWDQTGCGAGLGVGIELESGTRIEAGTFNFPEQQVGDGVREQLSESVTVITYT